MIPSLPVEFRVATIDQILPLRHAILRAGRPLETASFDGDDEAGTLHIAGLSDGRVIACGTLIPRSLDDRPAFQLRGMAVDVAFRGQGIGARLLAYVEQMLGQRTDVRTLWCNARLSAAGFYERHGWRRIGDVFDVPPIGPHIRMTRSL